MRSRQRGSFMLLSDWFDDYVTASLVAYDAFARYVAM
jgi:hypothetical protein